MRVNSTALWGYGYGNSEKTMQYYKNNEYTIIGVLGRDNTLVSKISICRRIYLLH